MDPKHFPDTNKGCRYTLSMVQHDAGEDSELMFGKVARSVLEKNTKRDIGFWSYEWTDDFNVNEYPETVYAFHLRDRSLRDDLKTKIGDDFAFEFESEPNSHYLKFIADVSKTQK